jgi:hypothetical protein
MKLEIGFMDNSVDQLVSRRIDIAWVKACNLKAGVLAFINNEMRGIQTFYLSKFTKVIGHFYCSTLQSFGFYVNNKVFAILQVKPNF